MRKAIASVAIVAFIGLLTTSLLAVFSGSRLGNQYVKNQSLQYPYFMTY